MAKKKATRAKKATKRKTSKKAKKGSKAPAKKKTARKASKKKVPKSVPKEGAKTPSKSSGLRKKPGGNVPGNVPRKKAKAKKRVPVSRIKPTPRVKPREADPAFRKKQVSRNPDGTYPKGVSGNPSGRPAFAKEVREYARQFTEEAIDGLVLLARQKKDLKVAKAAWDSILDRAVGRPAQEVTGGDGEPLFDRVDPGAVTIDNLAQVAKLATSLGIDIPALSVAKGEGKTEPEDGESE